jgi:hypothetical protein
MIMNRLSPKLTNSIRLIDLLAVLALVMFSFAGCKKTIAFISIKFDKTSLTLALKSYINKLTSLGASTMANQSSLTLYCGRQTASDGSSMTLALTLLEAQNELWNYLLGYPYNEEVNVTYKKAFLRQGSSTHC